MTMPSGVEAADSINLTLYDGAGVVLVLGGRVCVSTDVATGPAAQDARLEKALAKYSTS